MSDNGIVVFLLFTIVAGVVLMIAAMNNRRKMREMEHRERLAMIERGVVPSPESDPGGFEAATGVDDSNDGGEVGHRYRTAGVLLIGFGLGLIFVIGVAAGAPAAGWGIGGAWISLGAASLLNYWLMSRRRPRWSPPAHRTDSPPNIAP